MLTDQRKVSCATPLPRFDGRSPALPGLHSLGKLIRSKLVLCYYEPVLPSREVSRAALALALERAREDVVVFFCQARGDTVIRRRLSRIDPSVRFFWSFELPRLADGGAKHVTSLIRDCHASVVVIDNLGRLLPPMHWRAPEGWLDEEVRGVLRSIRRLISGFDRNIEAVLFHLADEARALKLFDEGFVDEIEELRP